MSNDSLKRKKCNLCDGGDSSCWRCGGKGCFWVWPDGTPYVYQGGGGHLYTQSARNIAEPAEGEDVWL